MRQTSAIHLPTGAGDVDHEELMAPATRPEHDRRDRWMDKANCRGTEPALFFPGQGEPTEPAKAVCRGCAVQDKCLEYALARPVQKHGIWGGMSESERRQVRRQRAQTRRVVELEGAA